MWNTSLTTPQLVTSEMLTAVRPEWYESSLELLLTYAVLSVAWPSDSLADSYNINYTTQIYKSNPSVPTKAQFYYYAFHSWLVKKKNTCFSLTAIIRELTPIILKAYSKEIVLRSLRISNVEIIVDTVLKMLYNDTIMYCWLQIVTKQC
jgi:hypothetical protein